MSSREIDRPAAALDAAWRALPHLALLALVIAAWEAASRGEIVNAFLMPPPSEIVAATWRLYIAEGDIWPHFFITLWEVVAGFAIGSGVGIALATASALSDRFRRYLAPYAIALNVTPGLALAPIVVAWFGFGISSKIALAAIICFFPVFVNTLIGLTAIDEDRAEVFRALGADAMQTFWKLRVPLALPIAMAGLKVGMTTALVGAIVAEFTQATVGVGVLMNRFAFQLDMAAAIAALLSMSAMGLLLFGLMEALDHQLVFWGRDQRMSAVSRRRRAAWRDTAPQPSRKISGRSRRRPSQAAPRDDALAPPPTAGDHR